MPDIETVLESVKSNCVGYYYPFPRDLLFEFGSSELRAIFPSGYVFSVPPIHNMMAFLYQLNAFSGKGLSKKQVERLETWRKQNSEKLFLFHTPLDLGKLVTRFKKEKRFVREHANYKPIGMPHYDSPKEYQDAIHEAIPKPYLLYCSESSLSQFWLIGDKQYTKELSSLLLEHPEKLMYVLPEITGVQREISGVTIGGKTQLVHLDTTRIPMKTVKPIIWD